MRAHRARQVATVVDHMADVLVSVLCGGVDQRRSISDSIKQKFQQIYRRQKSSLHKKNMKKVRSQRARVRSTMITKQNKKKMNYNKKILNEKYTTTTTTTMWRQQPWINMPCTPYAQSTYTTTVAKATGAEVMNFKLSKLMRWKLTKPK